MRPLLILAITTGAVLLAIALTVKAVRSATLEPPFYVMWLCAMEACAPNVEPRLYPTRTDCIIDTARILKQHSAGTRIICKEIKFQ